MENSATAEWIEQAKISETIRTLIRRRVNENGGISSLARAANINAHRIYNQMTRGNGVLAELIVLCAQQGIDEPLRVVADACGHEVVPKMKFLHRTHSPARPVRSHALDLHHATAAVTTIIEEALEDRLIDDREREQVKSALQRLRRKMAELEARIDSKNERSQLEAANKPDSLRFNALMLQSRSKGRK